MFVLNNVLLCFEYQFLRIHESALWPIYFRGFLLLDISEYTSMFEVRDDFITKISYCVFHNNRFNTSTTQALHHRGKTWSIFCFLVYSSLWRYLIRNCQQSLGNVGNLSSMSLRWEKLSTLPSENRDYQQSLVIVDNHELSTLTVTYI